MEIYASRYRKARDHSAHDLRTFILQKQFDIGTYQLPIRFCVPACTRVQPTRRQIALQLRVPATHKMGERARREPKTNKVHHRIQRNSISNGLHTTQCGPHRAASILDQDSAGPQPRSDIPLCKPGLSSQRTADDPHDTVNGAPSAYAPPPRKTYR